MASVSRTIQNVTLVAAIQQNKTTKMRTSRDDVYLFFFLESQAEGRV